MKTTAALATNKFGRILLHTACLLQNPAHAGWHWRGILREFSLFSGSPLPRITRMLIIAAVLLVGVLTAASHQIFEVFPCFHSEAGAPHPDATQNH